MKVIELSKQRYNEDWLRTVTEEKAVRKLYKNPASQVRNAWKQANGKTKRNYTAKKKKKS